MRSIVSAIVSAWKYPEIRAQQLEFYYCKEILNSKEGKFSSYQLCIVTPFILIVRPYIWIVNIYIECLKFGSMENINDVGFVGDKNLPSIVEDENPK